MARGDGLRVEDWEGDPCGEEAWKGKPNPAEFFGYRCPLEAAIEEQGRLNRESLEREIEMARKARAEATEKGGIKT